ncbi:hypothetical protein FC71_GL001302 [Latilactobacillus sakei subsp. carnosus DSM 15831]|uniref:glycoside hydrolase family 113 n=1 Tax=Latilactobacillus sakei TaxID=1599 RepID=UPI00019CEE24|nr:hypothetical protein [Latilactobacillus sakei]KRL69859.1 hypothetical protein FC71_GL001302 [Latilactobacillus sakei subsp. carnosus DSM 15831]GEP20599.1 hypothetical protein LSA03nite_01870 [Latilactobacillus sakei subsp. carnosus]
MANQVDYRDPTPNNFPQDYDPAKIDPRVKLRSKSINGKMNGADVRGALAEGLEIAGVVATEATETASAADAKSTDTQNRLKDQLAAATDANDDLSEIADARRPANTDKAYKTVGERLDNNDKLQQQVGAVAESVAKKILQNKLTYKSVSATIYTATETVTDDQLNHINAVGADLTLVTMVTVNDAHDPNPVNQDTATISDVLTRAKNIGLKTTMLKPHIGLIGQHDSFGRFNYDPSDYDAYFAKWQDLMLNYADICDKNNIPILCIGCEQQLCTDTRYLGMWQKIYDAIKLKYPDLIITYAMVLFEMEDFDNHGQIASVVDYIGLNIYPSYAPCEYDTTFKPEDLMTAWWHDYSQHDFMTLIDRYAETYNKPIYITESGIMPYPDGLARLISIYNGSTPNYGVQAVGYQALLEAIATNGNIIGLTVWSINAPFGYYDSAAPAKITESQQILTDYFKGGKI